MWSFSWEAGPRKQWRWGEISTGARSDLERATKLVRKMITEYGMSDKLGPMTFGHGPAEQVF